MTPEIGTANQIVEAISKQATLMVRDADSERLLVLVDYFYMRDAIANYLTLAMRPAQPSHAQSRG